MKEITKIWICIAILSAAIVVGLSFIFSVVDLSFINDFIDSFAYN